MKKGQAPIALIVGILVIVVVVLVVIGLNSSSNSGTGNVISDSSDYSSSSGSQQTQKICKDVVVPYEEQEPYQGLEEVQVNLKYEQSGYNRESYSELFNVREKGIVTIKNVDSETGYFTVKMYFKTLDDGSVLKQIGGYVQPSETKEFDIYYDIDTGEDVQWNYEVIPGTKTITRPVTLYRMVTKYRTEQQCE